MDRDNAYYRGPSIDHSILSPSGKCSAASKKTALARESEKLFPPGIWDKAPETEGEAREGKITALAIRIETLRKLADNGMGVKKHRREADRLENEMRRLEEKMHDHV